MKVVETYVVTHNSINMLLYKCEKGRNGAWFLLTAGAYGTRDMQLKAVSARKAAELIEETVTE